MNKLQEIFKAWGIAFDPNREQSEQAAKRIEICNSCEHKASTMGIHRCSVCGCALKAKVFSPVKGACPEGKWDEIDKVMEEPKLETQLQGNTSENTIFVQIASYRDPELKNTLRDLFDKAHFPENLRVGLCWQHSANDEWDNLDEFKDNPNVKIIDVPYTESKGVCWARHSVQQLYNEEKYTLQIDSHHRFVEGWDAACIKMIEQLKAKGHEKPLLTAYIPSFDPENDPDARATDPWWMTFDRFTPEGVVFFLPSSIPNWREINEPIPSRFYSAHFTFTIGEFSKEVQHDPEFYFHGEEITIAVRAFTHGYDLFHPHRIVCYHEYTRKGRTKQWDDDKDWVKRNTHTHSEVRKLLGIDNEADTSVQLGKYGLGSVRSLQDYEKYAGIRFRDRGVQQYTLDNQIAPNPPIDDYENSFHNIFKHCIDLYAPTFPENDYDFWVVSFEMNDGTVINRQDADSNEVQNLINASKRDGDWIRLWRTYTGKKPEKWVVWPHSVSKGWGERIEHPL